MAKNTMHSVTPLEINSQFQRTSLVKQDPEIQALLSKLVPSQTSSTSYIETDRHKRTIIGPDTNMMERLSDKTATNIIDATNLLQTLPDLEMAMQVTVSAILAPKDLIETVVTWRVEPGWIPSELIQPMLDVVREYFNQNYKISERLPDILRDVLYLKGSRPILLLPESSIDHLINSGDRISTESLNHLLSSDKQFFKPLGFLGNIGKAPAKGFGLENLFNTKTQNYNPSLENISLGIELRKPESNDKVKINWNFDPMVNVVDNPQILQLPRAIEKMRRDTVHDVIRPKGLATEAFITKTHIDDKKESGIKDSNVTPLYKNRQFDARQTASLYRPSALNKESVGHPTEFNLPPECVIPVHLPSDPETHLGYFILIDKHGNPLIKTTESDYFNEMAYNLKTNKNLTDQMISHVGRHQQPDAEWYSRQVDVDEMTRLYSEIMEIELNQRLRNGLYGEQAKVARPQDIYRIMFARALAGMQTQLLYVPAELMTYIAFDYNQYGIGVSLLQKSKILGGLRAIMLFADIMAGIKNSVGNTVVDIQLDEEDPDPVSTLETIMHEFAYGRSSGMMPLGTVRPRDIVNYMKQASVQYSVSGNSRLPTVKVSAEDKPNNRTRPDQQLQETLKKNHLNALGVSPETIDASQGPDFATTVVANNLMFAKRVMLWQRQIVTFLQDHVTKYILNSSVLMNKLRQIVNENKSLVDSVERPETNDSMAMLNEKKIDYRKDVKNIEVDTIIVDFLNALRIELPKPDQGSKKLLKEEFDNHVGLIESGLKYFIDGEFLKALELGENEDKLETVKTSILAHFVREWMRSEGVLPELNILTELDGDKPALDMMRANAAHVELLRANIGEYVKNVIEDLKKWEEAEKAKLEAAGVDGSSSGSDYGSDDSGSEDGGDDSGDEEGGDDDFGMDEEGDEGSEDEDSDGDDSEDQEEEDEEPEEEESDEEEENEEEDDKESTESYSEPTGSLGYLSKQKIDI